MDERNDTYDNIKGDNNKWQFSIIDKEAGGRTRAQIHRSTHTDDGDGANRKPKPSEQSTKL